MKTLAQLAYAAGSIGGVPWDKTDQRTRAHWARVAEAVRVGARAEFVAELEHQASHIARLAESGTVSPTQVWKAGKR